MPTISDPTPETVVDIVIPVYNEGANILPTLESLRESLQYRARILICYDHDGDDTLVALASYAQTPLQLSMVRNRGRGVMGAVMTGFAASTASCVIVMPAGEGGDGRRAVGGGLAPCATRSVHGSVGDETPRGRSPRFVGLI